MKYYVVCDLETTGVDVHRCDWITGSFSKIRCSDFVTESELELKSRPVNHWDEEARRIHRISFQTANEFPEREKSLQDLIDWLPPKNDFIFVCHANPRPFNQAIKERINVLFDLGAIKWDFIMQDRYFDFYKYFDEKKAMSTKTIANDFFGLPKELNLKEVCAELGIVMKGEHHDANADRKACEEILGRFLHESGSIKIKRERHSKLDSRVFEIQENKGMEEQQRLDL